MTNDDKIWDDNLKYDISKEAAKISALLSGKIDQHASLAGEEILTLNQRGVIEQAKFAYCLLKAFEKQTKSIEEQWKNQIDDITNQNKILEALTNKFDNENILKKDLIN